ncbi:insulinase family protein [Parashewanella spongiae]|uniref:Insulinase family protein n=1 Tax=Parashewanella spongiae TaxID=342950 RepID=A0A3A6U3Z3_9GAMM|nr:insulinase family protein [Parashewanella spongiae]MCL1078261.1 insulinase family protein [Parashewanella spongiae]RJY18793.1 insulinase family protein [Parashewanella spongiae]
MKIPCFILSCVKFFLLVSLFFLTACQQSVIEFTPVSTPQVPTFKDNGDFPIVKPDWSLADFKSTQLKTMRFGAKDGFNNELTVHFRTRKKLDKWRIQLVGINRTEAVKHADVLARTMTRYSKYLLNESQSICRESLSVSATYHSISINIKCFDLELSDIRLLSSFWSKQAIDNIDIDSVRRGLKLNTKIQSVTGSEIDTAFQKRLLGKAHPYLQVTGDSDFYVDLNKQKVIELQQKTAEKLEWHLLVETPKQLSPQELLELSQIASDQLPSTIENRKYVAKEITESSHSKTIYLLDAPDSVDIRVRIGFNLNKQVAGDKHQLNALEQLNDQKSRFACNTLSALLGRGSFGRLFYDLRSTRGLTYGAYAYCREQPLLRALVLYGSASIEHSGAFTEGMLAHLALIQNAKPEKAEVESLKLSLLGKMLIADDQRKVFEIQQLFEPNYYENKQQHMMWLRTLTSEKMAEMANKYLQQEPVVVLRVDADAVMKDLQEKLPEWDFVIIEGD